MPCAPLLLALLAQPLPEGMSPFIYGMHDEPSANLLEANGQARGWLTTLRYIGSDGTCGAGEINYESWAGQGYGIIMRLDSSGAPAQPARPEDWDGYASAFADCVARSSGIHVWVVGNEPNLPWGHPEGRPFSPQEYAEIYRRVVEAVDQLPNGSEHEVLFAALGPWAALQPWGDWDDGLFAALSHVMAQGGRIDGVAIHAYTRAWFDPAAIVSEDWFPGRENKWHHHFRSYRDTLDILRALGLLNLPLYITESGNACDPPCAPYPDEDRGYFFAMFEEVHAWNQQHPEQVIRAVTPYRWTQSDDGSGRDFCIGCRGGLLQDLQNAIAMERRWLTAAPPPPVDAGAPDRGAPDQGTPDLGAADLGAPDLGMPDRGSPNLGALDAGESSVDMGSFDAGAGLRGATGGGCGCSARAAPGAARGLVVGTGLLALLALVLLLGRKP